MNQGWAKFRLHMVAWFAIITLVLAAICWSGAPFSWSWVVAIFVLNCVNRLWTEWEEWSLGINLRWNV